MRTERIVITVTCDHCPPGESAEVAAGRVLTYGASEYELDLCAPHADILDKTLAGITAGTRQVNQSAASKREAKQFRDDCRAWANANGYEVKTRAIIPAAAMDAYREYLRGQVKP